MASIESAAYEIGNDKVPEEYRAFFDNGDWTLHKLVVYGSWGFFLLTVIAHIWIFSLHA
jgi:hypothetical protein